MPIIYICGSLKFEILNYCKYKLSAYSPLSPIAQPVHKNNSISTFISLQSSVSLVSTLTFFTLKFNLYMYSTLYSTQNASVKIYMNMYIFLTKNSFILDIKLYIFFRICLHPLNHLSTCTPLHGLSLVGKVSFSIISLNKQSSQELLKLTGQ